MSSNVFWKQFGFTFYYVLPIPERKAYVSWCGWRTWLEILTLESNCTTALAVLWHVRPHFMSHPFHKQRNLWPGVRQNMRIKALCGLNKQQLCSEKLNNVMSGHEGTEIPCTSDPAAARFPVHVIVCGEWAGAGRPFYLEACCPSILTPFWATGHCPSTWFPPAAGAAGSGQHSADGLGLWELPGGCSWPKAQVDPLVATQRELKVILIMCCFYRARSWCLYKICRGVSLWLMLELNFLT